ncbi:MAG: hypothetical protein ACR2LG_12305 [Actinomycetota bacterium]
MTTRSGRYGGAYHDAVLHGQQRLQPAAAQRVLAIIAWILRMMAEPKRGVVAATMTLKDAVRSMPRLARVGRACPGVNSVRWVVGQGPPAPGDRPKIHP